MAKIGKGRGKNACVCGYSTSNKGQWAKHQAKCGRNRTEANKRVWKGDIMAKAKAGGKNRKAA